MWKMTFFGLKYGQDLENRAAHPHQTFLGVPGETVPCNVYIRANKTGTLQCCLEHSIQPWGAKVLLNMICKWKG